MIEHHGNFYFVHDPDPRSRSEADLHYRAVYDRLLGVGALTKEELEAELIERGVWSELLESEIVVARDDIKLFRKQFAESEFKTKKKETLQKKIDLAQKHISKLTNQKNSLLISSADYVASIEKNKKLVFLRTFDDQNQRRWRDWNSFLKEDERLINKLIGEAFFNPLFTEANIRELARNDPWRSVWVAGNKVSNVLSRPLAEISDTQRVLLTWSIIYDSVYESSDRPSNEVINNDILLDNWLEEQSQKRSKDTTGRTALDKVTTNSKIRNSQEIGIVVETPEDAKKVFDLNDHLGKSVLKSRADFLKDKDRVKDSMLPDVKQDLMMAVNRAT